MSVLGYHRYGFSLLEWAPGVSACTPPTAPQETRGPSARERFVVAVSSDIDANIAHSQCIDFAAHTAPVDSILANVVVAPIPSSSGRRCSLGFRELCQLIASDLYRYEGTTGLRAFCSRGVESPGFKFTVWFRLAAWTRDQRSAARLLSPLAALAKRRCSVKYGISIPRTTQIGPGFYIGHFGGIVIHGDCKIGRDCNISHGVTLGQANRGPRTGVPIIGDRVYIGPGAKIVGAVRIGSNAAIGANAVVTSDVPDFAVVVGIPAKVISYAGSTGYVNRTGYPEPRPVSE
jgi:serine O-acetyltransferase